jgi:hypothetical protein
VCRSPDEADTIKADSEVAAIYSFHCPIFLSSPAAMPNIFLLKKISTFNTRTWWHHQVYKVSFSMPNLGRGKENRTLA